MGVGSWLLLSVLCIVVLFVLQHDGARKFVTIMTFAVLVVSVVGVVANLGR